MNLIYGDSAVYRLVNEEQPLVRGRFESISSISVSELGNFGSLGASIPISAPLMAFIRACSNDGVIAITSPVASSAYRASFGVYELVKGPLWEFYDHIVTMGLKTRLSCP